MNQYHSSDLPSPDAETGRLPLSGAKGNQKVIAWLIILNGEWRGRFYPLTKGNYTFGYAKTNSFILPEMTDVAEISHFRLTVDESTEKIIFIPGEANALSLIDDFPVISPYSLVGRENLGIGALRLKLIAFNDELARDAYSPVAQGIAGSQSHNFLPKSPSQNKATPPEKQNSQAGVVEKIFFSSEKKPLYLSAYISSQGDREDQQDAVDCVTDGTNWLGIVADGAGGHLQGGCAAQTALAVIHHLWKKNTGPCVNRHDWLQNSIQYANQAVIEKTEGRGRTTIATLYVGKQRFSTAHMGDTRIYQIREREIIFRTKDDSLARLLYDKGEISEAEMARHPGQSRLLKALGESETMFPALHEGDYLPGDIFLICTDGFWTNLENTEITEALGKFAREKYWTDTREKTGYELESTLKELVFSAVSRGNGKADNVSAAIVICSPSYT